MSNQLNFSQQMDEVLKALGDPRPRLLLHACCGPCSSAVLERLCRYFDITVLYYNPNTWPAEEYHRRGEELERFVAAAHPLGVTVVEDRYDPQEFYSAVAGLENEPERGSGPSCRGSPHLYRDLPDLGIDVIGEPLQVAHDPANQQLFEPVRKPVGEKIHKPSLKQAGQQGDQGGAQHDDAAARHELLHALAFY